MNSKRSFIMTEQRRLILEELRKLEIHPTADEIYELVRRRLPHISLGTVYRNLEILSGAEMIKMLKTSDSRKHFDGRVENHYHVRCVECGRIDDVRMEEIKDIDLSAHRIPGYKILSHTLEYEGVCFDCLDSDGK